jgi:hypothetical protein
VDGQANSLEYSGMGNTPPRDFERFSKLGRDGERGLQIASGAVVVALISGLTGYDANTSVADVEYRVAIMRGIGMFGASFVFALLATFTRTVAMQFAGEPLPRPLHWLRDHWYWLWLACLVASMIALFYAGLGLLDGLATATLFQADGVQTLPQKLRVMLERLATLERFLPWNWW